MKKYVFSDFNYGARYYPINHCMEVMVSFYANKRYLCRYMFLQGTDKNKCIKKAQKIIKQEIENGELKKYVKKCK